MSCQYSAFNLTTLQEIVLLLLRYDACATVINGSAQIPKDVTEDDEIITMLEGICTFRTLTEWVLTWMLCYGIFSLTVFIAAAQRREERKLEERLLDAAREGDSTTLSQLVSQQAKKYCLYFRCAWWEASKFANVLLFFFIWTNSWVARGLQISTAETCWETHLCTVRPTGGRSSVSLNCWGAVPFPLWKTKMVQSYHYIMFAFNCVEYEVFIFCFNYKILDNATCPKYKINRGPIKQLFVLAIHYIIWHASYNISFALIVWMWCVANVNT